MDFRGKNTGVCIRFLFQGKILKKSPDPGIELRSPPLQADYLPSKPPGKLNVKYYNVYMSILMYNPTTKNYSHYPLVQTKHLCWSTVNNIHSLNSMKWSQVAQPCPTFCNTMDCSLPGFSIHGIFQARELEWVAISFSRGSSWSRDRTPVSHIAGRRFTLWTTREAL